MVRIAAAVCLFASQAWAAPATFDEAGWVVEVARSRMARAEHMVTPPPLVSGPLERVVRPAAFEIDVRDALHGNLGGGRAVELRDLRIYAGGEQRYLAVCGEVTVRNIYGAIQGFDHFAVVMLDPDTTSTKRAATAYARPWIVSSCAALEQAAELAPTA